MSVAVRTHDLAVGRPRAAAGECELRPGYDKAISQRATVLASMADGRSRIRGLTDCADVQSNVAALRRIGVDCEVSNDGDWFVTGRPTARTHRDGAQLDCGNSATTARLLTAIVTGMRGRWIIAGNGSLSTRPMWWLVDGLRALGAQIEYLGEYGVLPLAVMGGELEGGAHKFEVHSAQGVSAMAFAALSAHNRVVVGRQTRARDHTERLLRWTGIHVHESSSEVVIEPGSPEPFVLQVPRDPSAAAYLAGLHLASPNGDWWLHMPGVCLNERRLGFFRIIEGMGCEVRLVPDDTGGPEPSGCVSVRRGSRLRGALIQGHEMVQSAIDELPIIAALATQADSPTVIRDASELRDKDTDRISSTVRLLHEFGVDASASEDGLSVGPTSLIRPRGLVVLPADHRIAFAAFVLALLAGGQVDFSGAAVTATSNPSALNELAHFAEIA